MRRLALIVGLFIASAAPLAIAPSQAAASDPYTLNASGVWVSDNGLLNGTWEARFNVAGYDLSGTLNLIGMPGVAQGNLQGSWDLDNLGFGVMFLDQELASFTGGLEGDEFVGHFDTGDVSGTWHGLLDKLTVTTHPIESVVSDVLPTLVLSRSGGQLGEIVDLIAKLYTLGSSISSLDNIITFDSINTPLLANALGKPDCSVNPAIGKADSIFEFLPAGCSGSACTQVHALVQSLSNIAAIADGAQLFACKMKIAKKAPSGIYQVLATVVDAIDSNFVSQVVSTVAGQISATKKRFGDCHCSTVTESGPMPLFSFLVPLALFGMVRYRRRRPLDS